MHRRNSHATFNAWQLFYDIASLLVAYVASNGIYWLIMRNWIFGTHIWLALVVLFAFVLIMQVSRMYNYTTFYYFDRLLRRIAFSLVVAALFASTLAFMFRIAATSRLLFSIFCVLSFLLVVAQRMLARAISRLPRRKKRWTKAIFVGEADCYSRYTGYLEKTDLRYDFVTVFDAGDERLRDESFLAWFLASNKIGEVVIVHTEAEDGQLYKMCQVCEEMGITVRLVMNLFEMPVSQKYVSSIGTFPVVTYHSVSFDNVCMFAKRVLDIVFSLAALVALSPVMLAVALAIRVESPGPVLFRQKRVGMNGKVFTIYKFRSMYADAEKRKKELMALNQCSDGMMFKIPNDPRITRVGAFIRKTSIDELPQLMNVLIGNMSLVGTRPPTLDEVEKYKTHHHRRISIKPGITGMWQVSGRSNISDFEQVVALDAQYIDNWSLRLDLKLLFMTVFVVLGVKGAY